MPESLHDQHPAVSIVILTCNRKEMVADLLSDLQRQTVIGDTEIIVVDNGSTDGTSERIEGMKGLSRLVRLDSNGGCAGRNEGLKRASGRYVVTLDDDVFLHRPDELEKIVDFFRTRPEADVVNFKILFADTKELIPFNWYHPRDFNTAQNESFVTDYISEGAVAFRRACLEKSGYYPDMFFLGHEGPDLALRLINSGCSIYYSGNVEVLHKCSHVQRTSWRNTYYDTRNYLWLLVRNYPIRFMIPKYLFFLCKAFIFSLWRRQLLWYFKAIVDSIVGLPAQLSSRNVLSAGALCRMAEIRKDQQSFMERLVLFFRKLRGIDEHME